MHLSRLISGVLFCCVLSLYSHSQSIYHRALGGSQGEEAYAAVTTVQGTYFVAGSYETDGFNTAQMFVAELSTAGDTLWSRTYGSRIDTSASRHDAGGNKAFDAIQCSDGGYLLAGVAIDFGMGEEDILLVRIDSQGDTLWSRTYGELNDDYCLSVSQEQDSGFVVVGYTESFGVGQRDGYVLRLNANGDTAWTSIIGGPSIEEFFSHTTLTDGSIVVAGHTFSAGAGSADVLVVKMDGNGNILWQRTYGGPQNDFCYDIISDGTDFLLCGSTESYGAGAQDALLMKIDGGGTLQWTKAFGGVANDLVNALIKTADGGIAAAGYSASFGLSQPDVYLIKTNATGDLQWSRLLGEFPSDYAEDLVEVENNALLIVGHTSSFGGGATDMYLVKSGANGSFPCSVLQPGTSISAPTAVQTSPTLGVSHGAIVLWAEIVAGYPYAQETIECANHVRIAERDLLPTVRLYPNPATTELTITLPEAKHCSSKLEPEVLDATGRSISCPWLLCGEAIQLDIAVLEVGHYWVKFRCDDLVISSVFIKH